MGANRPAATDRPGLVPFGYHTEKGAPMKHTAAQFLRRAAAFTLAVLLALPTVYADAGEKKLQTSADLTEGLTYRNTVTDMNGVKLTGSHAVAQSDTSVRALVYSAEELLCGRTRLHSGVLQKRLCSLVSSVTHNDRNFLFGSLGSYAKNLSQGGSHVRAACGTLIARQGMIRRQSVGIVVAARISASAAVGARKLLSQKSERLVYRYEKYLGSDCKYACAYETDYYYDQYRF